MYGLANCLISVLRGTSTSEFGDSLDNGTVAASGIPAAIVVRSRTIFDPSTQSARIVQQLIGTVGSAVDITDTDQIRDDTHGVTYSVEAVTQPLGIGLTPDLELELRRVD